MQGVPSLPGGELLGVSYKMPGVPSLPDGELLGVFYTMPGVSSLPEGELLGVTTAPGTGFTTGESPERAPLHCLLQFTALHVHSTVLKCCVVKGT